MRAAVLPRSFLPPFNEGTLVLSLQYNPGISLAESHRLGLLAERLLAKVPEVKSVGRRTGRAELDEHAEGVHLQRNRCRSRAARRARRPTSTRTSASAVRIAGFGRHRPADQPPARSSAVGHSRADRAQDLRAGHRDAAPAGRDVAPAAARQSRGSSIFRSRSRCSFRRCGSRSIMRAPPSTA